MRFFISLMIAIVCSQISFAQCTTPEITPIGTTTFCQGESVQLSTDAVAGLTYQWKLNGVTNVGDNAATYIATASGSYTVTISDESVPCTSTSNPIDVTVNPLPTATITPATATTFCQGGSVVLNANTGTGLSYQWRLNGTNISGATGVSYTANSSGSYTVVVTNASGCSATSTTTVVTVNALPTATITPANTTTFCQGGSVVLNANTGTGLTYQWRLNGTIITGATSASYTANASGSYTVVVTNASGCSATSTTTVVTVNALPTATITPATTTTFCQGGSVVLNANIGTGLSYQWRLNGTNITGATSSSYIANTSGSYTVVVTNASTCSTTSTATVVTVIALPTATITPATATTFCQGGSVVLNANTGAGLTYQWYNNATAISGATTSSYTANGNGSFTVVVSNSNSCSNTSSATSVVVNLVPDVLDPNDLIYCSGDMVPTIVFVSPSDVSGTYFEWQNSTPAIGIPANGNNNINSFISQNVSNTNSIATISVMPKTSFCNGTPQQFIITIKPKPSITSNLQESICTEQQFTFNPVNGTNGIVPENTFLSWTVNNTNVIGEGNNSNSGIGTISQTLTNTTYANNQVVYNVVPVSNGCTGNPFNYTVTVLKAPRLLVSPTSSICFGSSIQLFAVDSLNSGQLFYSWNNSSTLNNPYIFNPIASPASTTQYSVSVADNTTQCEVTRNVTVYVEPLPTANISYNGSNTICQGSSVVLNVTQDAGLTYQWRLNEINIPNATNSTYSATSSGIYSVVVSNASCSKTSGGVTVNVNPLPIADISNLSATTFCQGESVILNTTYVVGNTYQWKLNGINIQNANLYSYEAVQAGLYSVVVTNANSCNLQSPNINVIVNPLPVINVSADDYILCQGETTVVHASGAMNYSWNPTEWVSNSSSANPSVFPTSTMNFGVTGTDQNGCSNYDELQIVVSSFPSLDLPETIETCQGATVNLPGAAELSWSGITTSNQFIAGESGYAIGTSQNANFCISKDSIFIQVHELPTPTISGLSAICANASNATYTVPSTGNLFFWNVSNGDLQGVDIGNTAYVHWFDQVYGADVFVTITEHDVHNGCEGSDTLEVILDGLAPNPVIVSLLYPNGNTLYSSEHYAVMNWGSTIIANDVDEYADGHFQYYTYENFDTALRYYWVEVGDDEACVTRSYYNAPVWQIGIEEGQLQESIYLFPNPVTAFLNISAERNAEVIGLSMYNYAGELVLIEANPLGLSKIDMSLYPTGVYMLRLTTMDNHFLNYKIIKQ